MNFSPSKNELDPRFVSLTVSIRLKAYRYLGSKADELLKGATYNAESDGRAPSKKGEG